MTFFCTPVCVFTPKLNPGLFLDEVPTGLRVGSPVGGMSGDLNGIRVSPDPFFPEFRSSG